ncbi:conjugal transfer protein [Bacillus thuringiensis]|uniref:Conjugal transfer protein n=3 Tax=Bacillaceae TaxID=186817 RepID=A0A9X6TWK1_BACTU|nr:TcpE family conjugal transfer membrane protein [Bacillus gaemokensis]MBG9863512.1 hypothetical protein [Bacillus cereus]MBG9878601.1 hypothetical protein [Bacillus tropicus]MBJ8353614.1 hypothetical protein [Bacillus mycoides]PED11895.1 conjugal transfer protein [Bacillus thuringiensis]PGC88647.1 conjugal transfer protein [Bacillus toyonensis]
MRDRDRKSKPIKVYSFGSFMKYERRQYEILGYQLPRPVSWKLMGYFILIVALFVLLRWFPLTGWIVGPLADDYYFLYYVVLPILLVWGLDRYKTDGKSFFAFFRSWITFKMRTHQMNRSMRLRKPEIYVFNSPIFIQYSKEEVIKLSSSQSKQTEDIAAFELTFINEEEGEEAIYAENFNEVPN